jgi:hypothetical protein
MGGLAIAPAGRGAGMGGGDCALIHATNGCPYRKLYPRCVIETCSKRKIEYRLRDIAWEEQAQPMITASNIHYEVGEKTRAVHAGGIGLVHTIARETGLICAVIRHRGTPPFQRVRIADLSGRTAGAARDTTHPWWVSAGGHRANHSTKR